MNHEWNEVLAALPGFLLERLLQPEIVVGVGLALVPVVLSWVFSFAMEGMLG